MSQNLWESLIFSSSTAKLQDMEIKESDDEKDDDENESESEEPDKQMGDVEDDNQTNEVNLLFSCSLRVLWNATSALVS